MDDSLYSWVYGKYEKQKLVMPVVNKVSSYPGSFINQGEGKYPLTSAYGYDLIINDDNSYELTNKTRAYIEEQAPTRLVGSLNGKWVYIENPNNKTNYLYHITSTYMQTFEIRYQQFIQCLGMNYDKYYDWKAGHWVEQQGRILSTNIDAYPNDGFLNGVYYGNRNKIL